MKKSMDDLKRKSIEEYKNSSKKRITVVLDNVRSALNVGSIFRTCDAFSVEALVLCGITPCPPNNEIFKSALGSTESVEWQYYDSTSEAIEQLKSKNYIIVSIEQTFNSVSIDQYAFMKDRNYALVFGHEVYGINNDILNLSDIIIEVNQTGTKHSLNVSVCAGIIIYAFSINC